MELFSSKKMTTYCLWYTLQYSIVCCYIDTVKLISVAPHLSLQNVPLVSHTGAHHLLEYLDMLISFLILQSILLKFLIKSKI